MKVRFKIKNERSNLKEFIKYFKNTEELNNYRYKLKLNNCFIFKETILK